MQHYTGANPAFFETGRKPVQGVRGAVTSPNYLATQAGEQILRRGGHAVEGAIAVNTVLCVVYPHMAGLGGDLFALVKNKGEDVQALNGSGRAGEQATRAFYTEQGYEEIPDRGPLAANTVPGTVAAWQELHQAYGKLTWPELFEEAIYFAEAGFTVTEKFSRFLYEKQEVIRKHDKAAEVLLPDGQVPQPGEILKQPELAETLRRIADEGADAFYSGPIAEQVTGSLQGAGGLLTIEDMRSHESSWEKPLSTTYHDTYEVFEMQPNTQGIATLMMLNILESFPVAALGDNTKEYYHLMAEAAKVAFTYRDQWVTDPAYEQVPVESLLSDEHTKKMVDQIDLHRAYPVADLPQLPELSVNKDTTFFAAVDAEGNAVSMIQSIYHEFGSGFMADGGFLLQNRGSFFSLDNEHPNRLEPGKRTFHTIIPALALKDGEPFLLFGTMGGEGQPQTQCALLTRIVDFGYDVQQAIEAPRWLYGRTWGEDSSSLKMEKRIPDSILTALGDLGHEIEITPGYSQQMGHAQAVLFRNTCYEAGADPRGDGIALSW
ncbi:gamma-glutamyltransferase [Alkalicoccus luteus]|uniref:Glutathione hydrolase proenzyme n=1 Tax=Alkalicoccus luteus TaxID=1237094 RepID=A0A969TVN5_9BACI|nr:gamma-glutamyltransferase [Alkalicoccus luteus]NJP38590.1 gamma-glutamyltransferase [Alkalicoccus luteus]